LSKTRRLSDLSPARQALVRLCQTINHGSIEDLEVRHSEPVFNPAPMVLKDVKLDADEIPRPELTFGDFTLSDQLCRLLSLLDQIESGSIRHIEVRAGIPRRMLVESQELGGDELGQTGRPK
jgi:hypothetical protein